MPWIKDEDHEEWKRLKEEDEDRSKKRDVKGWWNPLFGYCEKKETSKGEDWSVDIQV